MAKIKLLFDRSTGLKVTETAPGEYTITQETVVGTPGSPSVVSAEPFTLMAGSPKPHTHDYKDILNLPTGGGGGAPTTAKYVVTAADAGLSNEIVIPAWADHPDIAPAVPSAEDDEFNSAVLDAKWTTAHTGAPTVDIDTTWRSHIYSRFTGDQSVELQQAFTPGDSSFSITAKFHHVFRTPYQGVQVFAKSASVNDEMYGSIYKQPAYQEMMISINKRTSGVWYYDQDPVAGVVTPNNEVYCHLQRVGDRATGIWRAACSLDGRSWYTGPNNNITNNFTVTKIGLVFFNGGANGLCRSGCDWFRRDWFYL